MRRFHAIRLVFCLLWAAAMAASAKSDTAPGEKLPNFLELYGLIRSNLNQWSETDLNRAAVLGLLGHLRNQVLLSTNATSNPQASGHSLLSKTRVFEHSCAYLRLNGVRLGSAQAVAQTFDQLRATNKLSGAVLDLRFAEGDAYEEAAAVADLFLNTEQPLLKWEESAKRSTAKTNFIDLPLILLVNRQTAGAAEALAAALRFSNVGLIVGGPTAGHAHVFKEFSLDSGQKVRIASGRIEAGDGHPLSEQGISPDIQVQVSEPIERAYLEDPYKVLPNILSTTNLAVEGARSPAPGPASRQKINESGLLRQRREESADDPEPAPESREPSPDPIVRDPALARALDVLKGLALVTTRR